jgi:hypothetical protein
MHAPGGATRAERAPGRGRAFTLVVVLDLPRSARLAAWGTAVLADAADPSAAIRAVTGDDEPHTVVVADAVDEPEAGGKVPAPWDDPVETAPVAVPELPPGAGLVDLFAALVNARATGLRLVLPAAGDVLGLPGPPWFNAVAVEAGECVLVELAAGGALALVPQVTEFGSEAEPGALVEWHLYAVRPSRVTDLGSVAEADLELRTALDAATRELARLDVARWREDAAERLALLRDGGVEPGLLPPTVPPRCLRVLATAARVRAIVELAGEDDGGSVTGWEAGARTGALRDLERVSRRAVVAAVNGPLERLSRP